jgi:hypothetical protein
MPLYPFPMSADETRPTPFARAEEEFRSMIHDLQSPESRRSDFATVEKLVHQRGMEVLRGMLQGWTDLRVAEVPVRDAVGADERLRTHHREVTRATESVFGSIVVTRDRVGARGVEALVPADAALNLPDDHFSFGVRERVVDEVVRGSFDQAVASIAKTTGADIAKRQAEDLVLRASAHFDTFYETRRAPYGDTPPPLSSLLVLTTDGKGVVMLAESLRAETRKAAAAAKPKLPKRRSKGEKSNRKRMATVAAIYDLEPQARSVEDVVGDLEPGKKGRRPKPTSKRVFASVRKSARTVIGEVFEEAERRDPTHARRWVALVDGNAHQIAEIKAASAAANVQVTLVLDVIHVLEYVWKAAWDFFEEGAPAAHTWVTGHLEQILRGRASTVAGAIRRSATLRGLKERKNVDSAAEYLVGHKGMMHYDAYLRDGLPIATGVIEGACRYLVKDRMDITGARWGLDGAEAVLRLRSIWASGDLDEYWQYHQEQEFNQNHRARYAANEDVWSARSAA